MSEAEQLIEIKTALGITGPYQDKTILFHMNEVKEYMVSAGVNEMIVNSKVSLGAIARGVADIWNYGNGEGKFSIYFNQRVIQLCSIKVSEVSELEQLRALTEVLLDKVEGV